jgi:exosortase C (VPDSG-CTERM-specific)
MSKSVRNRISLPTLKKTSAVILRTSPFLAKYPRETGFLAFVVLLAVMFARPLLSLAIHVAGSDLHSHVLLVPFISVYLIYIQRDRLPKADISSPGWAIGPLMAGLATLAAAWGLFPSTHFLSHNDYLALMTLAFLCFLAMGAFLFLGRKWMTAAAFPFAFLIFMIPLPDRAVDWLETASKLASAEAANWFFNLSGTPFLRDGTVFQLPGIAIEVAQECSGIRSSWVLFITGLLAAHVFLQSPWRRVALVAVVIPLGIIRNGFRIFVIGTLCVHFGPHMIHSVIHRRGGPLFFALSLVPLFLLLWWLRRRDPASVPVRGSDVVDAPQSLAATRPADRE